jgi:sulfate adenylyltransferase
VTERAYVREVIGRMSKKIFSGLKHSSSTNAPMQSNYGVFEQAPVRRRSAKTMKMIAGAVAVASVCALAYAATTEGMLSTAVSRSSPRSFAMRPRSAYQGPAMRSSSRQLYTKALAELKSEPHGGKLVDLMLKDQAAIDAALASTDMDFQLNDRQLCDTELIVNGGFSPLTGFLNQDDYEGVVHNMRLTSNHLLGLPVVLDTNDENIKPGMKLKLMDGDKPIAVMEVESKYQPDKTIECKNLYGVTTLEHPGCLMVATERGKYYLGGKLSGIALPERVFPCRTPAQVRATLPPGKDVVAFQCRNPVHRAHYELFTRALDADNVEDGGVVLVHPTCGPTQADDIPGIVRYKTYEVLKEEKADPNIFWEYLPYSMHMAGPREAIQHMIIRKNYGCTHFIIGRDMAGSKSSITGDDFYGPYDAQNFAKENAPELGMKTVPSLNLVHTAEEGYVTADYAEEKGLTINKLSGTKFRKMLRGGEDIPEWFAFKSVVDVLRAAQ